MHGPLAHVPRPECGDRHRTALLQVSLEPGVGGRWSGAGCENCSAPAPSPPCAAEGTPAAHRFQEALSDFRLALAQLRGHPAIDYTQLGLRFKLQAWEVRPGRAHSAAGCGVSMGSGAVTGGPCGLGSASARSSWCRGIPWPLLDPQEVLVAVEVEGPFCAVSGHQGWLHPGGQRRKAAGWAGSRQRVVPTLHCAPNPFLAAWNVLAPREGH